VIDFAAFRKRFERKDLVNITVVVYHVEKPRAGKRGWRQRLDPATHAWTHARMLKYTVQKCAPGAKFILLTDKASVVDTSLFDEVLRFDIDVAAIMYERSRVQIEYLKSLQPGDGLVCFLDTDMLILTKRFFDGIGTAPLALTIRDNEVTKVNGGVIVVNMRRQAEAQDLLQKALDIFGRDFADKKAWWGDQLAFDALLLTPDGSAIRQLHCDQYNYSPGPFRSALLMIHAANLCLLHFKGEWKRYMPAVFFRYWPFGCVRTIGVGLAFVSGMALIKDCAVEAVARIRRSS
jgi:hypothetical protein